MPLHLKVLKSYLALHLLHNIGLPCLLTSHHFRCPASKSAPKLRPRSSLQRALYISTLTKWFYNVWSRDIILDHQKPYPGGDLEAIFFLVSCYKLCIQKGVRSVSKTLTLHTRAFLTGVRTASWLKKSEASPSHSN